MLEWQKTVYVETEKRETLTLEKILYKTFLYASLKSLGVCSICFGLNERYLNFNFGVNKF